MLQQIVTQTPVYVWAILGFLVYRGVIACKDRAVSYRSTFIIPAVMLALGVQSIASGFGLGTLAGALWLASVAVATMLAGRQAGPGVDRAAGLVHLRGSWLPLASMMAIFVCKYVVAVALAVQPALRGDLRFAIPACIVLGLFNGLFLGRLLSTATAWNRAAAAPAVSAAV